jgi:hypothetical protein
MLTRSRREGLSTMALCFSFASCSVSVLVKESVLNTAPSRPQKSDSSIIAIMDGPPDRPRTDVVLYEGSSCPSSAETIFEMKRLAALRGLDGVHSITCGAPGTFGGNCCKGTGFTYN